MGVSVAQRVDYLGRICVVDAHEQAPPGTIAARRTPEGYLAVEGNISGVGVYEYTDADGNTWGELRLPEHVFASESMASFAGKPITDEHPPAFVTSDNWKEFARGNLGSNQRPNDGRTHLVSDMLITDDKLIRKIEDGKRELSNGYGVVLIEAPGVFGGKSYRFIQTQIAGNHNAVVDEARGGPSCRILDHADTAFTKYGHDMKIKDEKHLAQVLAGKGDAKLSFSCKGDAALTIGDQTFEIPDELAAKCLEAMRAQQPAAPAAAPPAAPAAPVPDDVANAIPGPPATPEEDPPGDAGQEPTPAGQAPQFKPKEPKDSLEALRAQVDSLKAQAETNEKNRGANIDARVDLVTHAKNILGTEYVTTGKGDEAIMYAIVEKVQGKDSGVCQKSAAQIKCAIDAKDAAALASACTYLTCAYDAAVEAHRKNKVSELMSRTFGSVNADGEDDDLMAACRQHVDHEPQAEASN